MAEFSPFMDHSLVMKREESTLSDGGGQRSLVGCSSWGRRESNTTGPPEEVLPGIRLDQGVRRVRVYGKSPGLSAGEERRPASACGFAMGGSAQGEPCGLKPDPFILSSPPDKTGYHLELSFNEVPKNAASHLSVRGATGRWTHCTDEEGTRWGFPGGSVVKYPPASTGDAGNESLIPGRRAWQPAPVFLSGESHGRRGLVGYSPWCCKESDTTEGLSTAHELRRMSSTQAKSRSTVASEGFISTLVGQVHVSARLVHLGSQPSPGPFSICSSRFIPLSVRGMLVSSTGLGRWVVSDHILSPKPGTEQAL